MSERDYFSVIKAAKASLDKYPKVFAAHDNFLQRTVLAIPRYGWEKEAKEIEKELKNKSVSALRGERTKTINKLSRAETILLSVEPVLKYLPTAALSSLLIIWSSQPIKVDVDEIIQLNPNYPPILGFGLLILVIFYYARKDLVSKHRNLSYKLTFIEVALQKHDMEKTVKKKTSKKKPAKKK